LVRRIVVASFLLWSHGPVKAQTEAEEGSMILLQRSECSQLELELFPLWIYTIITPALRISALCSAIVISCDEEHSVDSHQTKKLPIRLSSFSICGVIVDQWQCMVGGATLFFAYLHFCLQACTVFKCRAWMSVFILRLRLYV